MSRRKHQRMVRESWGRERVIANRPTKREEVEPTLTPEEVMWSVWINEVKSKSSTDKWMDEGFQPTPHHLIGVVTHPEPSYQKDESYHHQPLTNPSHLWCDEVHATDADVMRGNQKKG